MSSLIIPPPKIPQRKKHNRLFFPPKKKTNSRHFLSSGNFRLFFKIKSSSHHKIRVRSEKNKTLINCYDQPFLIFLSLPTSVSNKSYKFCFYQFLSHSQFLFLFLSKSRNLIMKSVCYFKMPHDEGFSPHLRFEKCGSIYDDENVNYFTFDDDDFSEILFFGSSLQQFLILKYNNYQLYSLFTQRESRSEKIPDCDQLFKINMH